MKILKLINKRLCPKLVKIFNEASLKRARERKNKLLFGRGAAALTFSFSGWVGCEWKKRGGCAMLLRISRRSDLAVVSPKKSQDGAQGKEKTNFFSDAAQPL
ncbi:MAG: hypothetical protein IKS15_03475 [Opitutales bacterium]|nr:hypothetical protein [Opitutales bacterium]